MKSFLLAGALLCTAAVPALFAQVVVDTTRADTLPSDTTDYTALVLKSQADARRLIPVPARIGAGALLPAGARLVVDRDSLLWHNAETVSDVLTKIPGVFLFRGGWAGRPELPNFQARGAASVEYELDGLPYVPMGQDSVMVDPSLLPVSFLDRIEIERLPGRLRVLMFTRRHDRSVPYSRIGIASGDLEIARYQGILEKRSTSGFGFATAFDHLSVPAQPSRLGDYRNTQGWIRLDYIPTERAGVVLQYLRNTPDREAVLGGGPPQDTLSRARHGARSDLSARFFLARGGPGGLGPRLDLLIGRTAWTDEIEKDSTRILTDSLGDNGEVVKT
ncbi:MAG TPA: TonB-dependent receptor plug domain-containing protein, partial [Gemmatimonadales bacterium]